MRHQSIPQSLTPEDLAQWIMDNSDRNFTHTVKTDLTEEVVQELEHKSSLASRAIDRLEEIKKEFMDTLKDGTPDPKEPADVTIPPTAGLKVLKANREWADKQLEQGYSEENIEIYMVPDPENGMMVAVDIEGKEEDEWSHYTVEMTEDEERKYGKPMLKKDKTKKVKEAAENDEADLGL